MNQHFLIRFHEFCVVGLINLEYNCRLQIGNKSPLIEAEGGDSCRMSETDETSQANAQASAMVHRSPGGKRPPAAEIIVDTMLRRSFPILRKHDPF